MNTSDWLVLGGLALGVYYYLNPSDKAQDSASGLPSGGGGDGSPWPILPPFDPMLAPASAPGYLDRFTDTITSPENVAGLAGLAVLTAGTAGAGYILAKRSATGVRAPTELPETVRNPRPLEPLEIRVRQPGATDYTSEYATRSPRLQPAVELPTAAPRVTQPPEIASRPGSFSAKGLAAGGLLETATVLAQVPEASRQAAALQATGRSNVSASGLATAGVFGGFPASQANIDYARAHPVAAVPVLAARGAQNITVGTAQAVAHPIKTAVSLGNNLSNVIKPGSGTFRWTGFHF